MDQAFFCNQCGAQNSADAQFCSRCGASTQPSAAFPVPAPGPSYPVVAPAVAVGYGGFWIRVVAAIVDGILVRVVVSPIGLIFGALGLAGGFLAGIPHVGMHLLGGGVTVILSLFGSWLYEAFMLSSSYQATVGKMIFGMKVSDLNGNRISFERATGRHFAKWLSAMILGIGYLMVAFSDRKQGLHDLLAGTLVRR
jgi:uncharacterized RDD family membrane protein YckC